MNTAYNRRIFLQSMAFAAAPLFLPHLLGGCTAFRSSLPEDGKWQAWSLEYKLAQMLLLGFPGTAIESGSPIDEAIRTFGVGGVVLSDKIEPGGTNRNISGPAQLQKFMESLRTLPATPLLIAVDQEGGMITRLKNRAGFPPSYSAQYLGAQNDLELTSGSADDIAHTLATYGINLNLAPVVDLRINPDNPVIALMERSFSADPALAAAHAAEFIRSHRRHGVLTCLKHFPGHGSSRDDSHLGLTDVTRHWSEVELLPYQHLISQGLCDMVMTAHTFNTALDPDYPATLSKATIDGILRQRLGFKGVVVSDDLNMGAIVRHYSYETAMEKAINAGVDLLLVLNDKLYRPDIVPRSIELLMNMVQQGRISRERIDQACGRIIDLKKRQLASTALRNLHKGETPS